MLARDGYWQDFCGGIKDIKINFKNCFVVIGRSIEKFILPGLLENEYIDKVLKSIARVKQRIRPGRHTPRQSDKPINKWKSSNGGLVIYA